MSETPLTARSSESSVKIRSSPSQVGSRYNFRSLPPQPECTPPNQKVTTCLFSTKSLLRCSREAYHLVRILAVWSLSKCLLPIQIPQYGKACLLEVGTENKWAIPKYPPQFLSSPSSSDWLVRLCPTSHVICLFSFLSSGISPLLPLKLSLFHSCYVILSSSLDPYYLSKPTFSLSFWHSALRSREAGLVSQGPPCFGGPF